MIRLYRLLTNLTVARMLFIAPMVVFFVYFFALRYNIPWFDEFENIPYFLNRFLTAPSFSERVAALLRPNNEHRVLYARLVVLGQYYLTGGLNFGNLMLWGNAGLVLMTVLMYRALRRHAGDTRQALVGTLPVPLLLFTAQSYLMTFTAIFTLQYLSIIMLVMLTFFVLATDRPRAFGIALGLGVLSTFSMGNGLLLWPAGVGMLVVQRRWAALGMWVVVGAVSSYLYFLGYPVQQGNAEGFSYVLRHPFQTLAGFIIFAGSTFDLFPAILTEQRMILPFGAGMVVLMGLGYWLVQTLLRSPKWLTFFEAFAFGCVLFLLANIALIAFFRLRFSFALALHGSYRIYSLTLWAFASTLLFSRLSDKGRGRLWPVIWLLIAGINALTYYTYLPEAVERKKHMQGMVFNQLYSGVGLGGSRVTPNLTRYIDEQLALMKQRGWYQLPNPTITPAEQSLLTPVRATVPVVPLRIEQRPDYIIVYSDEPDYRVGLNQGAYLVMKSDRYTYLMFANKNRPTGRKPWEVKPGWSAAMPAYMIEPGYYRLGLFRTYPDHSDTEFTDQFVDVSEKAVIQYDTPR